MGDQMCDRNVVVPAGDAAWRNCRSRAHRPTTHSTATAGGFSGRRSLRVLRGAPGGAVERVDCAVCRHCRV